MYLKNGGKFRCVVPDISHHISRYVSDKKENREDACIRLMKDTYLGWQNRPKSILQFIKFKHTNSYHFWMWDSESLIYELKKVGFKEIIKCSYHDSPDKMFDLVEDPDRINGSVYLEAIK